VSDVYGFSEELRLACHDIRQPIAGVLALAGAALTEARLPEDTRARLNQIVKLAEWQSAVVEHWLQAPASSPADSRPTDIAEVINEATAAEQASWTSGELTLVWPSEPLFVPLHKITMCRMVANLLANATRAAGPSGSVTIEVSRRASRILLTVEDNGPGFGRLPRRSGLGLSAVAREAVKHQGKLECGRGSLGGARVSLWLPAVTPGTRERPADAACAV
jgi:C4-dicarboxylate-specific signal transduction histidine kinase